MTYDFDSSINRRGTNSLKWDVGGHELTMWVACPRTVVHDGLARLKEGLNSINLC